MTIQVPLQRPRKIRKQIATKAARGSSGTKAESSDDLSASKNLGAEEGTADDGFCMEEEPAGDDQCVEAACDSLDSEDEDSIENAFEPEQETAPVMSERKSAPARRARQSIVMPKPKQGRASAARVSRGHYYGEHKGLPVTKPKRNAHEHVTVTCVLYNTVIGGVPNKVDVLAAIEDMEKLYAACTESGRLADASFDFMKTELTVGNVVDIQKKISTQPPVAENPPVVGEEPVLVGAAPASVCARGLVLAKLGNVESAISSEGVLELKMLSLGALGDGHEARVLVSGKFQCIQDKLSAYDKEAATILLLELKLILLGALPV